MPAICALYPRAICALSACNPRSAYSKNLRFSSFASAFSWRFDDCLCFAYQSSKLHALFCLRVHYIMKLSPQCMPEKSKIFLADGHSPYHSSKISDALCKHCIRYFLLMALLIAYAHYIITLPVFTILFHKLCHLLSHGAQYQKLLSRNPVSQIKEPLILFLPPGSHHHKLKNPLS